MKLIHNSMSQNKRNVKAKSKQPKNFDDLLDDEFQNMYWTESTLLKALPKAEVKIKKMKSRENT